MVDTPDPGPAETEDARDTFYDPVRPLPDSVLKRKPGRPTIYRRQFCELVVALGAQGKSRAQIATDLDVSRITLLNWEREHPEFLSAMQHAKDQALSWWERAGQLGLTMGKEFNAAVYAKAMNARFREDYAPATEIRHSGSVGLVQVVDGSPDAEV